MLCRTSLQFGGSSKNCIDVDRYLSFLSTDRYFDNYCVRRKAESWLHSNSYAESDATELDVLVLILTVVDDPELGVDDSEKVDVLTSVPVSLPSRSSSWSACLVSMTIVTPPSSGTITSTQSA